MVSRQHAAIARYAGEYLLFDLGSTFGTFVNGRRFDVCMLQAGDSVQLAKEHEGPVFEFDRSGTSSTLVPALPASGAPRTAELVNELLKKILRDSQLLELRRELEREMRLAEKVQKTLLPSELPDIQGYRLCAYSNPSRYVGGDFYDFFHDGVDGVFGVLGDVSGKGTSAALIASVVIGSLQSLLRSGCALDQAVSTLNAILCEKFSGSFVTLFLFQLSPDGKCKFVSAGHNPAYVYRRDGGGLMEVRSNSIRWAD